MLLAFDAVQSVFVEPILHNLKIAFDYLRGNNFTAAKIDSSIKVA